ncbi:hypothetical protein HYZ41_04130 [archaeon]|nr:hypothetical protein [archaeon]
MEIRETLFKKTFSIENEDPYRISLDFMRRISENYTVYETKNIYMTDGPVKKCTLVFDVIEPLDNFSRIRICFTIEGENRTLYVDVIGEFIVKIGQEGFFTDIFTEFYINKIFPGLRKISEKRVRELEAELEKAY